MEIHSIAAAAASAVEQPLLPRPVRPSFDASVRFAQLMAGDDLAGPDLAPGAAPAPAAAPPATPTLGDAILNGLRGVSQDMSAKWSAVSAALESPSVEMVSMLKLQLTVAQMSVQYELVGKAISKSTQNLDQLVKLQ